MGPVIVEDRLVARAWGALLLCLIGLAAMGLETVSFGHGHLTGAHASHHNHLYLGAHQHHGVPAGHDHSSHDQGHHEAPAPDPQDPDAPHRTATVSVIPTLFQPVVASVLTAPVTLSVSVVPAPVLPLVVRPAVLLIPPRAPPAIAAAPAICREPGSTT